MSNDITGNNGVHGGKKSQLIITLDHDSFGMEIGGSIANLDCALAMCRMAAFELEGKIRAENARISLASRLPVDYTKGVRQ